MSRVRPTRREEITSEAILSKAQALAVAEAAKNDEKAVSSQFQPRKRQGMIHSQQLRMFQR